MNARQKAKKYKRLYEESRVTILRLHFGDEYHTLKHYTLSNMLDRDMVRDMPEEALMRLVSRRMAEGLIPLIEKNAEVTKDLGTNRYIYQIDLWARN